MHYGKLSLLALLTIVSCLQNPLSVEAATKKAEVNQDIVFLVDTSSSMRNIFEDVRKAILDYAQGAQTGDTIILISFGEKVNLDIRQKITSPEDVKRIERELRLLEPDDYYTYITGALDSGMEELHSIERKNPDHLRTMVLLSDGKNNPPPSVSDPVRFDDLLKRYPGLLQGPGSSFFYLSLGDNPDPDVVSWMKAAKGTSLDLGKDLAEVSAERHQLGFAQVLVEPISIDLGTVPGPKADKPISLAFFPARGDASGQGIQLAFKASYRDNPSWKTILEIQPASVTCSNKPWTTTFTVRMDSLQEGIIVGKLELQPLPGHVLFIDPPEIPVTMTVRQPRISVDLRQRLKFGPIRPGAAYHATRTVRLVSDPPVDAREIRASPSIALPDGVTLITAVENKDDHLELQVTVEAAADYRASHSLTVEGTVDLSGIEHTVKFSHEHLEVSVQIAPPPAQSRFIAAVFSPAGKTVTLSVVGVAAAVGLGFLLFRLLKNRPSSALEGKLLLVNMKDKSFDRSRMITANLHTLGRSLGGDSITIGSAKDADLTIPHKSIANYHCQISVRINKGTTHTFIEPVGDNPVIVNLQKITEPTPLSDRDLLEIGTYTFRFENPHPYKQIVVKYLDGRILKGTPATWDIESDGFGLLPRDSLPGSNEEIYVSFSDLKALYFVRDFDGQIGKKIVSPATQIHGLHMLLKFHDDEKMEGYTSQTYSPASPRFYFFPADQSGNTISLLVERKHLKSLEILDPEEGQSSRAGAATVTLDPTHKNA